MDHDFFYDGRYLGSRETAQAARNAVNEYVYDLTTSGELYTAIELDAPVETLEEITSAQINAWNKMDEDERLFAAVVTTMMEKLPESHRAMGEAGLILLTAACNSIGPKDDGNEEEAIAAHTYRVAYKQGYEQGMRDGFDGCLAYLEQKMTERQAVAA